MATGVWVIAHECGHQAFSKWQSVNDAVGLVLHSALLVPYYSWYEQRLSRYTTVLLSIVAYAFIAGSSSASTVQA